MIALHRIDHVCLRVADVQEAARRWALQFGLTERAREAGRAALSCDDEAVALELVALDAETATIACNGPVADGTAASRPTVGRDRAATSAPVGRAATSAPAGRAATSAPAGDGAAQATPGFDHVGWELARGCTLDDAAAHLDGLGVAYERRPGEHERTGEDVLWLRDLEGNGLTLLPYREPTNRLTAYARPAGELPAGHPRKLGHVNFLTGRIREQLGFYVDVLGMRLTDWLGDGGVWLHVNPDHHAMALVDKGRAHFHHLALDVVDVGQMRAALDHLGRHGRWLGWGPTRHGVGGNVASYVRIVEEECFVELYCDMEILGHDHLPREWPDDRYSSNTWGPLPPRSYFRFDAAAVESERQSLESLGVPLPPAPAAAGATVPGAAPAGVSADASEPAATDRSARRAANQAGAAPTTPAPTT